MLQNLITSGSHIPTDTYVINSPLVINRPMDFRGSKIIRDYPNPKSSDPVFYLLGSDVSIRNVDIDILRSDVWVSFVPVGVFTINEAQASRIKYNGSREYYTDKCIIDGVTFLDSKGRTKANSGVPEAQERDHWGFVSKSVGRKFVIQNCRMMVPDMEMTGTTQGWSSILFDNNHIIGGSTTAPIDILSKSTSPNIVRNLTITNNTIHDVQRQAIAFGYDGNTNGNQQFKTVRITDNRFVLSPDCNDDVTMLLGKFRNFDGCIHYDNNRIDGNKIHSKRLGFNPIDAKISNDSKKGEIFYRPSNVMYPLNCQWSVSDGIKRTDFESVS